MLVTEEVKQEVVDNFISYIINQPKGDATKQCANLSLVNTLYLGNSKYFKESKHCEAMLTYFKPIEDLVKPN